MHCWLFLMTLHSSLCKVLACRSTPGSDVGFGAVQLGRATESRGATRELGPTVIVATC